MILLTDKSFIYEFMTTLSHFLSHITKYFLDNKIYTLGFRLFWVLSKPIIAYSMESTVLVNFIYTTSSSY